MKYLLLTLAFVSALGFARGGTVISPLPTNHIFPVPGPILFPGYTTAAGNNPAALGAFGKGGGIQGSYSPTGSNKEYFAGLTASSPKMGVNLGYIGDDLGGTMVNSVFAGAGFQIDPIAVGFGLRQFDLSGNFSPDVDLGLIAGEGAGKGQGLRFGFVIYNLNSPAQLDLGIGFSGGKKYNMEVNLLLPPFSGGNGGTYTVTVAGNIFAGEILGINFATSYTSNSSNYLHKLGLTLWPWDQVSFFAQFTTPSMWTGGAMIMF